MSAKERHPRLRDSGEQGAAEDPQATLAVKGIYWDNWKREQITCSCCFWIRMAVLQFWRH